MKKIFLAALISLTFANISFGCGCAGNCKPSFAASNDQKECQNIFSLIAIDFSFLSPRAAAADVDVGMQKLPADLSSTLCASVLSLRSLCSTGMS